LNRMPLGKRPETAQMNLLLSDRKPLPLPEDKQRELAAALADLLLNAAVQSGAQDTGDQK
jgi:hypothetical protein